MRPEQLLRNSIFIKKLLRKKDKKTFLKKGEKIKRELQVRLMVKYIFSYENI
jgi:hypothetical protein